MSDIKRAKRGAWPGPTIEPDATTRANLAQLGRYGVRYGAMRQETTGGGVTHFKRGMKIGLTGAYTYAKDR